MELFPFFPEKLRRQEGLQRDGLQAVGFIEKIDQGGPDSLNSRQNFKG